ncbi:MAG: hypothetical protein NTU44_09625 [Bacteroidetes bacterium]|nr:hypothetical protein [Bacteroidota bacterium]
MQRPRTVFLLSILFVMLLTTCEKDPGIGGNSSIKGYVHVTDYNATFLYIQGEYDGADEDVYIVYGDEIGYSDRTRAGSDGKFEFKYLRKGQYKIYVYSEDTTLSGKVAVIKNVEITGKKQHVDAGTFEIKKK